MKRKNIQSSINHLRLYRKKNGLSQKEIATLMGYRTATAVSHYERGAKLPNLTNALKLEIILHTPTAYLFGDLYTSLKRTIEMKRALKERSQQ